MHPKLRIPRKGIKKRGMSLIIKAGRGGRYKLEEHVFFQNLKSIVKTGIAGWS